MQPQYLEAIQNSTCGHFACYEENLDADEDVAWLCEHNHIVNPPTVDSLANRKCTSSHHTAN